MSASTLARQKRKDATSFESVSHSTILVLLHLNVEKIKDWGSAQEQCDEYTFILSIIMIFFLSFATYMYLGFIDMQLEDLLIDYYDGLFF